MIHVEHVINLVSWEMGVHRLAITGPLRYKSIAFVRHVAMFVAREQTLASYPEIGRVFGNRDHTTVMVACTKIELLLKNGDVVTTREVERLRRACAAMEAA